MKESAKNNSYGNESISSLKGADRVRKRPAVIFGSDGLEGCEHAVFEILSNSIDEAREGHGSIITVTRYTDKSFSASCMPAANTTTSREITTSSLSVSTVSVHALPSTHRNTWTSRYGATVSNTICTSRRARSSVNSAKRSSRAAEPAL